MPDFGRRSPQGGDPSLNEIAEADRFIDALSAKQTVYSADPAEAHLAYLLSGWRDDVRDVPIAAPITAADATAALQGGLTSGRRPRRSFAVVGSVAAAMLCVGGFGTAVYGAGPGDALYGVRTALFGQPTAPRDDQVALASAQLQEVQQLIDQGQWQQAQDKLVAVSNTVQGVDPTESKVQLVEQWNALTYKVVEQDPAATLAPGEPLPVLTSSPLTWLPIPVVETPTETTSVPSDTPGTPITTDPSGTSTTSPVPPESSAPDTSTSTPTSASTPPSTPPTATSTTTTPPTPTTSTPPPTPTTTTPPTPTTSTPPPPTTTTTSRVVDAPPPAPAQPPSPPAELPPAQPRLVPTAPITPSVAEASTPAQAPAAPAQPSVAPTTSTAAPRPAG